MQFPTANLRCAVALDDHSITMAPIIRMIFTMEASHRWSNTRYRELIGDATVRG